MGRLAAGLPVLSVNVRRRVRAVGGIDPAGRLRPAGSYTWPYLGKSTRAQQILKPVLVPV
jgi:hypothetical protein